MVPFFCCQRLRSRLLLYILGHIKKILTTKVCIYYSLEGWKYTTSPSRAKFIKLISTPLQRQSWVRIQLHSFWFICPNFNSHCSITMKKLLILSLYSRFAAFYLPLETNEKLSTEKAGKKFTNRK